MIKANNQCYLVYLILLIIFVLQSVFYPNFILAEEHHYLGIASNMFYHQQWWRMESSEGLYLSKPPLLFWMLSGLWFLFGAHIWVIHFLLFCVLASILCLTQWLYRLLFDDSSQAKLAPLIVLGCFFFFSRSIIFCFDSLVVMFFLLSAIGIVLALKHYYLRGFFLFGAAVGLGILTKGPLILVFSLSFFAVATFFRKKYHVHDREWFSAFILSETIIFELLMAWLLPLSSFLTFRQWYILLLQRGFSIGHTYGYAPFYFYITALFVLLFPWMLWPYGIKSLLSALKKQTLPMKIVLYSLLLSLIIFSLIPPKEIRYIMSIVVLFSLLFTFALFHNKEKFCIEKDGTRNVLIFLVIIIFVIEIVSVCFPKKIMSYIIYPNITYEWVLLLESLVVASGCFLIFLKKRTMVFETMRLCGFIFVMVLCFEVLPHEILSTKFPYNNFINYLNSLKNEKIPIIYCRTYGGYQYSMTTPTLPEQKYQLRAVESLLYHDVYFVREDKVNKTLRKNYLYRLVDPSQDVAIFVEKISAKEVTHLSLRQERCKNHQ